MSVRGAGRRRCEGEQHAPGRGGLAVPGCLVSLEGGEASGKTTQLAALQRSLVALGFTVVTAREPGGTPMGERLRTLLLDARSEGMEAVTEVLLFAAARAEVFIKVIAPGLAQGFVVLCDRFVDSSLAYQGYGLGVELALIREVNAHVTGGRLPDITLVLDVPVEVARSRLRQQGRVADRIEERSVRFHEAVRQGYRDLALAEPRRVHWVDGTAAKEEVSACIVGAVLPVLGRCAVVRRAGAGAERGGADEACHRGHPGP